jgi:hypothetical protein
MNIRRFILLTGFFLVCAFALTQDITVRALLDTNKGLIGDQFILQLQVTKPADSGIITFPAVTDKLSDKIEVLAVKPVDTARFAEGLVLTQELLVTVFDTGFFEIPALSFGIGNTAFTDSLQTLPVIFEIQAMKADSTIRDIKAIYRMPVGIRELAPYGLAVAALGILTWLIFRYIRKRKARVPRRAAEIYSEPADIIALRDLAELRDEKPWLNNRIKYYYSKVSDILRTYIERRFETLALEQTTGEILMSLENKNIDAVTLNRLSDILKLADLVKFAKVIPDPEQNAIQIGQAEEFVRNTTRPAEEKVISEEIVESNT